MCILVHRDRIFSFYMPVHSSAKEFRQVFRKMPDDVAVHHGVVYDTGIGLFVRRTAGASGKDDGVQQVRT